MLCACCAGSDNKPQGRNLQIGGAQWEDRTMGIGSGIPTGPIATTMGGGEGANVSSYEKATILQSRGAWQTRSCHGPGKHKLPASGLGSLHDRYETLLAAALDPDYSLASLGIRDLDTSPIITAFFIHSLSHYPRRTEYQKEEDIRNLGAHFLCFEHIGGGACPNFVFFSPKARGVESTFWQAGAESTVFLRRFSLAAPKLSPAGTQRTYARTFLSHLRTQQPFPACNMYNVRWDPHCKTAQAPPDLTSAACRHPSPVRPPSLLFLFQT
jgi:hypothetical protein